MSGREQRQPRSAAEWVTFAVSLVILGVVVGAIVVQHLGGQDPAAPVVDVVGEAREQAGHWFVPVSIRNDGDATAENVQVAATLTVGDETYEGDQTVDFLSGGEIEELEFAFDVDPSTGELEVTVTGFVVP